MPDAVVIDFETANERRGSPCSAGYAVISGLSVDESGSFLIHPPEMRFAGFNVSLHGVTPAMCEHAPAWPVALQRLEAIIANSLVLAHYTPFDIGVIRDTCADTGVLCPELHFACTRSLARMVWPDLGSYCLPDVAAAAGVVLTSHHDAESDALAAAGVAIAAARLLGCGSVPEIYTKVGFYPGTLQGGLYTRSTAPGAGHRIPRIPSGGVTIDPHHPFYDHVLVFTGGMMSMTRHDAQQAVVDVGGRAMSSVGKKADFVVVGGEFHRLLAGHQYSQKLEKALELRATGRDLELLNEVEFLTLLRGGRRQRR
ncbi:MAG: exonuclease domain-containing protein [Acidimicrobiales bacterium]